MKKVIFSLKSIALVAMASVAMVSCGGDDNSAPAPNPTPVDPGQPITANNSFVYDGVNYTIDGATFVINSLNPDAEDAAPNFVSYQYEEGEDAPSHVVTEWYVDAYPEFAQGQQPEYFLRLYFDVEAGVNAEGQPTLLSPAASENIFPYQVVTVEGGTVLTNTEYAYGNVDLNFSVFSISGNALTAAFNGAESVNDVTYDFNNQAGLVFDDWNVPAAGAKSTNNIVKARKNNLNNVTNLKVVK